ncbi:uncharacterized protein J3R85_017331 [Psidium guajava]|nr:uncharacterized protein J3R85_017331 [Psidium guajava]
MRKLCIKDDYLTSSPKYDLFCALKLSVTSRALWIGLTIS